MNLLIPGRKRTDVKNSTLANPSQIPDDCSLPIFSKHNDETEFLKELGESGIQKPLSNKKRGHPLLIDGEDFIGVESL